MQIVQSSESPTSSRLAGGALDAPSLVAWLGVVVVSSGVAALDTGDTNGERGACATLASAEDNASSLMRLRRS